jgi:hypothetical protein
LELDLAAAFGGLAVAVAMVALCRGWRGCGPKKWAWNQWICIENVVAEAGSVNEGRATCRLGNVRWPRYSGPQSFGGCRPSGEEFSMPVAVDRVLQLCRVLKGLDTRENLVLTDYLKAIPRLGSLADVPAGTPVLVRGDVDCKPGAEVGQEDIRLRSMKGTLEFGRGKGWKQILFGHLGRKQPDKPIGSLAKVAKRLGQILGTEVELVEDWLDEATGTVKVHVTEKIAAAKPGSVLVLQNVRAYDIETVLWKANEEALPARAPKLAAFANSLAEKVASVYAFGNAAGGAG